MDLAPAAVGAEPLLSGGEAVVLAHSDSIVGTYDGPRGLHTFITATADPNVVRANGSWGSGLPSLVCEMVRSSTSPLVWNGVLPPQLGGAPIRWEFEPGSGAFISTAGGKPTTRYVKRVAYRDSTIAGTYDGPSGLHCVIVATADPNLVQAHGSWGGRPTLVCEMVRSTAPMVWNGVLPPQSFGGAPIRWEFEPGLGAFTSTAGGKAPTRYVKRASWNAATVSSPQPTLSGGFDIEEGHEDPALRHGQKWARIWCPLGGDPHLGNPQYRGKGVAYHEPVGLCCFTKLPYKEMPDFGEILGHCLFWIFFIGVQAIPLYYIYENIPPSLSPATRALFAVHSLFMEVLSIWVSIPVLLLWCLIIRGCCDRTNAGILPCSMHRVTPYFARKYPHLVTRGPAAQR
jgi:hypothetical protein